MGVLLEQRAGPQVEQKAIRGAGLVVAHVDTGKVLAKVEKRGRFYTGRNANDITIPFETMKLGEPDQDTLLGAMAEVFDDRTFPKQRLFTVGGLQLLPRRIFFDGQRFIDYSLGVVLYDGPEDAHFEPHDREESIPFGLEHPNVLLQLPNLRTLARDALADLEEQKIITNAVGIYRDSPSLVEPVVGTDFVLSEFYNKREELSDVEPYDMEPGIFYSVTA